MQIVSYQLWCKTLTLLPSYSQDKMQALPLLVPTSLPANSNLAHCASATLAFLHFLNIPACSHLQDLAYALPMPRMPFPYLLHD